MRERAGRDRAGAALCVLLFVIFVSILPAERPPPAPHPRLLFSRDDVPAIRARVREGMPHMMYERLLAAAELSTEEAEATQYAGATGRASRMAAAGLAYVVSGEERYARTAEALALNVTADPDWTRSQALRQASLISSVAMAYDLCYDAWGEPTRTAVGRAIAERVAYLQDEFRHSMVERRDRASNWVAVVRSGAGLGALAVDGDQGDMGPRIAFATRELERHFESAYGRSGLGGEGLDYTWYPLLFYAPFVRALERSDGKDFRRWERVARIPRAVLGLTVPASPGGPGGVHVAFSVDGSDHPAHGGTSLLPILAPEGDLPAIRWMWDRLHGLEGAGDLCGGANGLVYGILFYPADIAPENPAAAWPLAWRDETHGVAVFRDRYRDEDDTVLLVHAHTSNRVYWNNDDLMAIRLVGLGNVWSAGAGRNYPQNLAYSSAVSKGEGTMQATTGSVTAFEGRPDGSGRVSIEAARAYEFSTGEEVPVTRAERHVAVDFGRGADEATVIAVVDRFAAERTPPAFWWNFATPSFNAMARDMDGHGFSIAGGRGPAASLKAWVVSPADGELRVANVTLGAEAVTAYGRSTTTFARATVVPSGREVDFFVVMTLQRGEPPAPSVEGSGLGAAVRVAGRTVRWDAARGRVEIVREGASTP